MINRHIVRSAIFIYTASLLMPFDGMWLGGLLLFLVSALLSFTLVLNLGAELISEPEGIGIIPLLFYPYTNIAFIWCASKFDSIETMRQPSAILLMLSTAASLLVGLAAVFSGEDDWYLFVSWSAAFVVLSIAVIRNIRQPDTQIS